MFLEIVPLCGDILVHLLLDLLNHFILSVFQTKYFVHFSSVTHGIPIVVLC